MTMDEAVTAANTANPDVTIRTTTTFEGMPDGGNTVVTAEHRGTDGKLYAAWHTIEPPERIIDRLIRQARAAAGNPMDAPVGA